MSKTPPSKNLITVDGLVVDKLTGEAVKPSVFSTPADYQPSLHDCRSVDDFARYLKFVDRRKLPAHTLHPLRDEVDYARGIWCRRGIDCRITLPQQRLLETLHQLVVYRNVIFMTQAALAKVLGVDESNLMKKLKVLVGADMLRISTSRNGNIRTGEVKLVINPRFVFRGGDFTRDRYVEDWYCPVGYLHMGDLRPLNADECFAVAA
ncbi:hypothetical protein PMI36_03322 [Pseudomonas sp. GM79]|uniref:hypothetical protein n=1 Tax=Pseudomonas sp. GM79 TaxID=1144338 RepID=UPI00026F96A3|nr:hypothetical protein [Pseudomonas sp. GM79]EJN22039.1 hypothetical protein PMI36_03322 [Pseudomonas sp. GM79]